MPVSCQTSHRALRYNLLGPGDSPKEARGRKLGWGLLALFQGPGLTSHLCLHTSRICRPRGAQSSTRRLHWPSVPCSQWCLHPAPWGSASLTLLWCLWRPGNTPGLVPRWEPRVPEATRGAQESLFSRGKPSGSQPGPTGQPRSSPSAGSPGSWGRLLLSRGWWLHRPHGHAVGWDSSFSDWL